MPPRDQKWCLAVVSRVARLQAKGISQGLDVVAAQLEEHFYRDAVSCSCPSLSYTAHLVRQKL